MSSGPNPATTDWVPLAGAPISLAYKGDWVAGTYQDGDIVIKDGIAFECVGGPTAVAPDITVWGGSVGNRPPQELAYGERTTTFTVVATSEPTADVLITLPPITVDGATPIIIEFNAATVDAQSGAFCSVSLWDGSTSLGVMGSGSAYSSGTTAESFPMFSRRRITPAPGVHTYSARVHSGGGAANVYAGTGGPVTYAPASLRIVTANPVLIAPSGLTALTYGTTLPSSPANGQEAILVDSITNPTFQWRFRYNAGNTTAHKWEYIGGRDVEVFLATQQGLASPSGWQNLPTDGPSFTIPVTGVYTVEASCNALGQTNQTGGFMGIATGNNDPPYSGAFYAAGTGWSGNVLVRAPDWNLPAGQVVKQRYTATVSDMLFNNRHLRVVPRRALAS